MGLPPMLANAKGIHPSRTAASACSGGNPHRACLTAPLGSRRSNRSRGRRQPARVRPPTGSDDGHCPRSGGAALDRLDPAHHQRTRRDRHPLVGYRSSRRRGRACGTSSPIHVLTCGHHSRIFERHPSAHPGLYHSNARHFSPRPNSNRSLKPQAGRATAPSIGRPARTPARIRASSPAYARESEGIQCAVLS